jgi:hypothetical protein
MTMSRPSVVFWFARVGNGPTTGDPQLVLCDASGFGVTGGHSIMRLGTPGNSIEGWAYEHWPRRGRTFTLRIYELGRRYGDATLIDEFTVRNPKPYTYPVWTARPPPITAHEGDLSVTLTELVSGVRPGIF